MGSELKQLDPALADMSLDDKYELERGTVFMTGIQALVRLPIEQARRDRARNLRTGIMISGYPGSPLGGYDLTLARARRWLDPLDVKLVPGLNEELAASNVWGSQMKDLFGPSRFDGVTGIWYGKSPGVDRCLDIFRHANYGSTPDNSAMLALAGDDPQAKSSSLPNQSEWDFVACGMPVIYPASVGELLRLGLHGIAISRLVGVFVGMKCLTNLCDGAASIEVGPELPEIVIPDLGDFRKKPPNHVFLAPESLDLERHLFEERMPAVIEYGRANHLNEIVQRGPSDRLGIIASGKSYSDLVQAFEDAGLDEGSLARLGVRVLKVGMPFPLDRQLIREFGRGLDEIVVIEEKRDLVESQAMAALFAVDRRPAISGKRDAADRSLFPPYGELDADKIVERLAPYLRRLGDLPRLERRLKEIEEIRQRKYPSFARRLPNYCPGCPHNRSTVSMEDEIIGGGVGCHGMGAFFPEPERQAATLSPMGAEGAYFIGAAPWVESQHFFQNMGDGTFFHSGSQALRATVAAGIDITYKLLFNSHVSMTGGQTPVGARDVATLTNYLQTEGVRRTIVVSENYETLRQTALAANAELYPRERYEDAMRELKATGGVTVMLFDQECAAEKRRARKRGRQPEPDKFVFINEEVCEGCGDCGSVSNCMSVQPVETEFGRKTQIQLSSCNKDYSCVKGDCPSFLTVRSPKGLVRRQPPVLEPDRIPEPAARVQLQGEYRVYMPGVGGTGVVTTNQVLANAAMLESRSVHVLDQTGLAQKGGSVLSALTILDRDDPYRSNRVGLGQADLLLALDPLTAISEAHADRISPERTAVVADATLQPTSEAVRHVNFLMPGASAVQRALDALGRPGHSLAVEAGKVVQDVFGDHMLINSFMVGVAYQAGYLPLSSESIEAAYRLNGVSVDRNLQAFRYGRLYQNEPAAVTAVLEEKPLDFAEERDRYLARVGKLADAYGRLLERCQALSEESRRLLAVRIGELIMYQDAAYAERYVEVVLEVFAAERRALPAGGEELTQAAIRHLYKLMAYKDEYEVARLLLKGEWAERIAGTFVDPKVSINLHPPMLRERGLKRKLELGPWFRPLLGLLIPMRRVRGTWLDVFGRAEVRRTERELVVWYRDLLAHISAGLTPLNYSKALQIASAPDRIRGYEQIKMNNVKVTREYVDRKLREFDAGQVSA